MARAERAPPDGLEPQGCAQDDLLGLVCRLRPVSAGRGGKRTHIRAPGSRVTGIYRAVVHASNRQPGRCIPFEPRLMTSITTARRTDQSRRFALVLGVVALLGAVLAAPAAAAGPDRYQTKSATWTVTLDYLGQTYNHVFSIAFDPCTATFKGTGTTLPYPYLETIRAPSTRPPAPSRGRRPISTTTSPQASPSSGRSAGEATGFEHGLPTGFTSGDGGDNLHRTFTGVVGAESGAVLTTWKNHGEYLTSVVGGADAAHSCIGKPIEARPMRSLSEFHWAPSESAPWR